MSLSNWDTMAFDKGAKPCDGVLKSHTGSKVEIYKNWAYVHDKSMWCKGGPFVEDTIAQVWDGRITISNFIISAKRYELQSAMFVFAITKKYVYHPDENGKDEYDHTEYDWMAGIACCGYDDCTERLLLAAGKDPKDYEGCDVCCGSSHGPDGDFIVLTKFSEEGVEELVKLPQDEYEHLDSQWAGVTPELHTEFIKWLEGEVEDCEMNRDETREWLNKVKTADPVRFNQGDAFFAENLGMPLETVGTKIGEAEESVLTQALKDDEIEETPVEVADELFGTDAGPFEGLVDAVTDTPEEKAKATRSILGFRDSIQRGIVRRMIKKVSTNN